MLSDNIFIKQLKKHPLSFAFRLVKNLVFALFLFCLVLIILYIAGNYQDFRSASQLLILSSISYSSVILFVLDIVVIAETVMRLLLKEDKAKSVFLIIFLTVILIFSLILMSFSTMVKFLAEGIN